MNYLQNDNREREEKNPFQGFTPVKYKQSLYSSKAGNSTGFTIVELLVVIGIIAIIASAVIVVIAPGEKMKSARESTRVAHFSAIGSAFHLAVVRDNGFGNIAEVLEGTECNGDDEDSVSVVPWSTARKFTDDCAELVGLGSAPTDPQDGAEYRIKSTLEGVSGRLIIYTTATESVWQEDNPIIH